MLALYRKYRPQKFQEVIGQDHITTTLKNSIKMGKEQHAYLFCGPKGTGKTSLARIISKTVNCLDSENLKKTGEPCLECENCQEIVLGNSIDIIEVDAASNRGIDEIRELREKSRFTPAKLKYKVFIIDEVHMLTKEAFNALLKTLEEPPAHIIFILATTEPHKMPDTVKSRCQRFDLRRISQAQIISQLKAIAPKENIKIDDQALHLIAANSDGSSRDALSLLGSLTVFDDIQLTLEKTKEILGFTDQIFIVKFIDYLIIKDATNSIKLINQLLDKGVNLNQFTDDLLNYLRKLLLLNINPDLISISEFNFTAEQLDKTKKQAMEINQEFLLKFIDSIILRRREIAQTPYPQLPLELAIVETLPMAKSENSQVEESKDLETKKTENPQEVNPSPPQRNRPVETSPPASSLGSDSGGQSEASSINITTVREKWGSIIQEIKKTNFSLGGILNSTKFIKLENNNLTLACQYPFHKEKIGDIKNKLLLEDAICKFIKQRIKAKFILIEELPKEIQDNIKKETEIKKNKKAEELYDAALSAFGEAKAT